MTHDDTERAWAAGLFEGEGFIVRRKIGNRVYMSLGIEMRDKDIIERFVTFAHKNGAIPEETPQGKVKPAAVIQRKRRKENNPKHSDIYRWVTTGHTAERVYLAICDELGERRRAKGDAIVEESRKTRDEARTPRPCRECGTPMQIKDYGNSKAFCNQQCRHKWRSRQPGFRENARERQRRWEARRRTPSDAQCTLELSVK